MRIFFPFSWVVFVLLGATAQAAPSFDKTRDDPSVPASCNVFELRNFGTINRIILVGPEGARGKGFTHEYPILREDAAKLWELFKFGVPERSAPKEVRANPRLTRDYALLAQLGPRMGFDFGKEGDVLEALALELLKSEYPESEYFHTGGLSYGDSGSASVIGELDIIIGRRSDCSIVAIGETKLGLGQRKHALDQLRRFTDFAKSHLCRNDNRQSLCELR